MDDEVYYQAVAEELRSGVRKEGLWTKAIAKAGGDLTTAQALYIELRATQLIGQHRERVAQEKHARSQAVIQRLVVGTVLGGMLLALAVSIGRPLAEEGQRRQAAFDRQRFTCLLDLQDAVEQSRATDYPAKLTSECPAGGEYTLVAEGAGECSIHGGVQ